MWFKIVLKWIFNFVITVLIEITAKKTANYIYDTVDMKTEYLFKIDKVEGPTYVL